MIRKTATLILLTAVALLFSGCIYLRLLELKRQLARFDRYFAADLQDGLKLTCQKPVLLDQDMAFFQWVPESRQRVGVAERWHFRWIKAYPAPAEDPQDHEITADFIYVDRKLTRVILPERFFTFLPKPLFLMLLRSLGHAEIDREKRTARARLNEVPEGVPSPPPLTQSDLTSMLGAPMKIQQTSAESQWHYRYTAASAGQQSGRIDIVFSLDPATQRVRRIKGQVFEAALEVAWSERATSVSASGSLR